jgi:RHS repeat-associated protein
MSPCPKRKRTTRASNLRTAAFPARRFVAQVLAFMLLAQTFAPPALAAPAHGFSLASLGGRALSSIAAVFGKTDVDARAASAPNVASVPVAEEFGVVVTPLSTAFAGHTGIEHHQALGKVVVSSHNPTGLPVNFETLDADGTHRPHSNVAGLTGGLKIATARDDGTGMSRGGFKPGELFSGTGVPGAVARVSPDGASVQNPWVRLPGEDGQLSGGLFVDRTGVFGGDLIAVTTAGGVWRINSAGVAAPIANLGTTLAGVATIPDDPTRYGPWAGKILAGAKDEGVVYAIDAQGNSTGYQLGINPEDIRVIPAHENFYGVDPTGGKIWGAPDDAFAGIIGDILIAQGSPGVLARVRWNGTEFEVGRLAQVEQWGQITFSPAALSEIGGVKQFHDRLAVVNHAPQLDSGRVEGALWQLLPENVVLDGTDAITSDLLVPGVPTVVVGSGKPSFDGVIEGVESTQPTGYSVTISNNASLRHVITRTNPINLTPVPAPTATTGTRDVFMSKAVESIGDAATLRHLSISGKAGAVAVPPGSYGKFTANGHTQFVLGVANSTTASVYDIEELSLSGGSELRLVGPVKLNVRGNVSLSGSTVGAADNPQHLLLSVSQGSVGVTGNGVLYAVVRNPQGTVSIGGNGRIRGTVTCDRLSIHGNGVLQITENDVAPPPVNRPPVADAGTDQTITLPTDVVSLNGTAMDDGLPSGSTLAATWSKVSGPAPVVFADPGRAVTSATFTEPGSYVLRLTVNDSLLTVSDEVTVEVLPRNQPPVVNAGANQTVELPNTATLAGIVTDDALPRGSNVTKTWSVVSAPGGVTFADPHDLSTVVTFAAPGDYTLRLTADDTEFTVSDDVVITVRPENQPPVVNAGDDQTIALPASVSLNGTVTDDGLPSGGTLKATWSKLSGPGLVTFGNVNQPATTASFSDAGTYVLRLEASDSQRGAFDDVTVSVLSRGNAPPDITSEPPTRFSLSPAPIGAGEPVNLAPWTVKQYELNSQPNANWVKDLANNVATQTVNADASFLLSDFNLSNAQMDGTWRVDTNSDDDFIGFVFGYQNSEHFYVFDWKKGSQNDAAGFAERGMSVKVFSANSPLTSRDFWPTAGNGTRVRTLFHNTIPWQTAVDYQFTLQFRPGEIKITVRQGAVVLADITVNDSTYTNGLFGFYNYSQSAVKYSGFRRLSLTRGTYTYDVEAADPDGETLTYSLDAAPSGMTINPATGLITWPVTPREVGAHQVVVRVQDPHGASDTQSYTLNIIDPTSEPPFKVYTLDADFDEGSFVNITHSTPHQLQLNSTTATNDGTWSAVFDSRKAASEWGRVGWTASACGDGLLTVSVATGEDGTTFSQPVTVSNGQDPEVPNGRYAKVSVKFERASSGESPVLFDLSIGAAGFEMTTPTNRAPDVNAGTDQTISGVTTTTLRGAACDDALPSNHRLALSWSKLSGPGAVTFSRPDSASTEVNFAVPGIYELKFTASDSAFSSSDTVVVEVLPANEAPAVNAGIDRSVTHPERATLNGIVTDDGLPRGSTLLVTWSKVSGPGSVNFSEPNAASTTARFGAPGAYILRLTASDTEFTTHDELAVTVNGTNQSPVVNAGADLTITLPKTATLSGTATDDGWPEGSTLVVSWSQVSGPGTVNFATPNSATTLASASVDGTYVLRLTASDAELTASDEMTLTVNAAVPPPVAQLTSPADGSRISDRTNIVGSVSGGAWRLEYSLNSLSPGQVWTTFASGNTPVTNGLLGVFDPTLLLNGSYTVRLVATNASGQTSVSTFSTAVTGELKVGVFTLSFTDLVVPVAGIPITISRTYDSRDKRTGDFGVGWTLGMKNVRLEKSQPLGNDWEQTTSGGIFPTYCLRPVKASTVTVTFPDGTVYDFATSPNPQCQALVPVQFTRVNFTQLPGDADTRGATLTALGSDNEVFFTGSAPGFGELLSNETLDIYNPTRFQLTTSDGSVFIIDEKAGLQSLRDTNGNTLNISSAGIIHSSGKSISFTRDAQGRITRITDPAGNNLNYTYDLNGDLISMSDQDGRTTRYAYNSSHGLLDITDPMNRRGIRNEYDASGRLVSITDEEGKTVRFEFAPNSRQQVITDRRGNVTVYEYDAKGNVLSITNAHGKVTRATYDGAGNRLTETDEFGNVTTYTYDARGNVLTKTDAQNRVTRYTYNARNKVTSETDANGNTKANAYDAAGNLTSTTDALGNTTTFTYNPRGLVLTRTDAAAQTASFEYNSFGNLTKETDRLGNVTLHTYDALGNHTSVTDARGNTTQFNYDASGLLTSTVDALGNVTRNEYDPVGNLSVSIDALGHRTEVSSNFRGMPLQTTQADGTQFRLQYDANGHVAGSSAPGGLAPTVERDALSQPTKLNISPGISLGYQYDAKGRKTTQSDPLGNTTSFQYNLLDKVTLQTDPLGNQTHYTYDAVGNLISLRDGNGNTTSLTYDRNNRPVRTTLPDGSFFENTYNALGEVIAQRDAVGNTTTFTYNNEGSLLTVTQPGGGVTRYEYDSNGGLISSTDANGRKTVSEYDKLNRLVKRTYPDGTTELITYDGLGRPISQTDRQGRTTTYEYDQMNRLSLVRYADAKTVAYTYTPSGKRDTVTDASGVIDFDYDAMERVTSVRYADGTTITYAYDLAGNRTKITTPDGETRYSYDVKNRLAKVTDPRGLITSYTYDGAGNVVGINHPNGLVTVKTYDRMNRLSSIKTTNPDGNTVFHEVYTRDANGRRTKVVQADGSTVEYAYDAKSRLTVEIYKDAGGNVRRQLGYTYDAVGNRLAVTDSLTNSTVNYTYNGNDQMTSDGAHTFAYDANGNTISKTISTSTTRYAYDARERLTQVTQPDNSTLTYGYDANGNRVRAVDAGGNVTNYVVDSTSRTPQVLVETDGSGRVVASYTYGLELISQRREGVDSFYLHDALGSTRALTDGSGAVTDSYSYDAFGELMSSTGTTVNSFLYTGEQHDVASGLYYLRARYYNPSAGRFISMDPYRGALNAPATQHRYAYTQNNPVNATDPTGLYTRREGTDIHKLLGQYYIGMYGDYFVDVWGANPNGGLTHTALPYGTGEGAYDRAIMGGELIRPDLRHYGTGDVYEIKPLSPLGVATAVPEAGFYTTLLNWWETGAPKDGKWKLGTDTFVPPIFRVPYGKETVTAFAYPFSPPGAIFYTTNLDRDLMKVGAAAAGSTLLGAFILKKMAPRMIQAAAAARMAQVESELALAPLRKVA